MSEERPGSLTQWMHDVASAEYDSLAPYRDRIMFAMGVVASVLVLPFAINNFLQERWIVGVALAIIDGVLAINTYALWRWRRAPIPYALLFIPFIAGITAAVVRQGVPGVLWSYPVVVFCYFVLGRRIAHACVLATLLYTTGLAAIYIEPALAIRLFVTLLLTIAMTNIVLNVIADLHRTLASQALTDPLTGVFNRRFMQENLAAIVARAQRRPLVASILVIDIDHFKQINDRFGHDRGDETLCSIVELVGARARSVDRLFRWGGEEFLLLLEETDLAGAIVVAEAIRARIETAEIIADQTVTVSIGASQYEPEMSADAWMKAADTALYRAKNSGRNRVVAAVDAS